MRGRFSIGLALAVAGCASTDLGNTCQLASPDGGLVAPVAGEDIVQVGNGECQQFICASFAGSPSICSQPCASVGDSCGSGLVCRPAVLDPQLLAEAQARTQGQHLTSGSGDDFQNLLGGVTEALYCGPPIGAK